MGNSSHAEGECTHLPTLSQELWGGGGGGGRNIFHMGALQW